MDWKTIGKSIVGTLPILGGALAGPAGAAVGTLVSGVLGVDPTPQAVADAVKQDPDALVKLRQLQAAHETELTKLYLEAETSRLAEINQTMRAELVATDPYNRRWRATWGYATAFAWVMEAMAIVYVILFSPDEAPRVLEAMAQLGVMWGMALGVLGINISRRSRDKSAALGVQDPSLLGILLGRKQT